MTALKDLTTGFGKIEYNGYTFSPMRKVKFEAEPQYDEAGWTVTHTKYKIIVHAVIWGSDIAAQQAKMASIHEDLAIAGRTLKIEDIGFYTDVDTSSTTPEVIWGAKPRVISISELSGGQSAEVIWQCEFNINTCAGNQANENAFMAFNYDVFYSTNDRGFVTRRISGYFEIAQKRSGNSRVPTKNLETFFDRVTFSLPDCFKRLSTSRRLSSDRRRLEFTVIDEELTGLPFPEGIVEADMTYDWESKPPGFINWQGTLAGTMEVAPGFAPSLAAQKFFILLFDKASQLQQTAQQSGGVVIPERLRIGTQVFGRTSRFSASFRFVGCLSEILSASGMWRPMPGTSFQKWKSSMANSGMFHPRGRYGLRHNTSDDAIIDLCASKSTASIGNDSGGCQQPVTDFQQQLSCANITKENSWLTYKNRLRAVIKQRGTIHRAAQEFSGVALNALTVGVSGTIDQTIGKPAQDQAIDFIFQYEGAADNMVIMQGSAMRIKYAPDIPKLVQIGNIEVEELSRNVDTEPLASFFGCPLYLSRWAILYRVKGQMQTMKPSKNKTLCITEGENDGR
jgi:hypothetical protein